MRPPSATFCGRFQGLWMAVQPELAIDTNLRNRKTHRSDRFEHRCKRKPRSLVKRVEPWLPTLRGFASRLGGIRVEQTLRRIEPSPVLSYRLSI
mmetsp:Transcript_21703/g.88497  ORF Transcript_21703/g.88497 Transcript_21703/m.88497 type:complete len:94 (-) Transcript_21703:1186-1467(-)